MSEISKTVDKALTILTSLSAQGRASLQQLSDRTQLNRTVTQRILVTLTLRGFITRSGNDYEISPRLQRMSEAVFPTLRRATENALTRLSREAGATAVLQVFDDGDATVIEERLHPGTPELRARLEVGTRTPLTATATGIAILAALEPHERRRALSRKALDIPPGHVQSEIDLAEQSGVAVLDRETHHGVHEIAAPVRTQGPSAASIGLLTPLSVARELGGTALRAREQLVRQVATEVEEALTHHAPLGELPREQ